MVHDSSGGARCQALLIEADPGYRAVIATCLGLARCRVEEVPDLDCAVPALERRRYDLVVWGVPTAQLTEHRGLFISELRLRTRAPLILLDASFDMAQFDLETGADQWLPKPFVPGALVGSVRAALRTSASAVVQVASRREIRGMVLDAESRTLSRDGSVVSFTRQEWELLSILVSHPNRYLRAREILRLGWQAGDHGPVQLRTYVRRLRLKLDPLDLPCRLLSQHGEGYRLTFD